MQITHEEVRKFIQFNSDEALNAQEKSTLYAHLKDCSECRAFAEEIKEMEGILVAMMKRQWNVQPVPLSVSALTAKRNSKLPASIMLATRTAAIGVVLVAFIFSAWQFSLSAGQPSNQSPAGIQPVPTPSTQSTSTKIVLQNCEEVVYDVRENDTLESIAYQFSISKEEIMSINNMKTETVNTATKLMIPICNYTPTGTVHPTTWTTTYTPAISPTTSTPGG